MSEFIIVAFNTFCGACDLCQCIQQNRQREISLLNKHCFQVLLKNIPAHNWVNIFLSDRILDSSLLNMNKGLWWMWLFLGSLNSLPQYILSGERWTLWQLCLFLTHPWLCNQLVNISWPLALGKRGTHCAFLYHPGAMSSNSSGFAAIQIKHILEDASY